MIPEFGNFLNQFVVVVNDTTNNIINIQIMIYNYVLYFYHFTLLSPFPVTTYNLMLVIVSQ